MKSKKIELLLTFFILLFGGSIQGATQDKLKLNYNFKNKTMSFKKNQRVELKIQFFPLEHRLNVKADWTFDKPQNSLKFILNSKLALLRNENYELIPLEKRGLAQVYELKLNKPQSRLQLIYQGEINEAIKEGVSPGIITDQGIALLSDSFWHPSFFEQTFDSWGVEVELPSNEWNVMMPGDKTELAPHRFRFDLSIPPEEWALVADRYFIFKTQSPSGKQIQVWLKSDEPKLAKDYLELIPSYIENYSQLIGPFPFNGYAVIENSLETGYAFPGFTLLGPSVIRLPFLLRSSLPHEILHSWWGNSVFVDYERGNWCEGLTTYMADHAYAVQDQKGPGYRRSTLQNFQDFVTKDRDFPLRRFVSRNDRGTQAVGYGKSMMLFQMLENHLGTKLFYESLAQLYKKSIWKSIGFAEVQGIFEATTQQNLDAFFSPWLDQLGAPKISIVNVSQKKMTSAHKAEASLELILRQEIQKNDQPYLFPVRLRIIYHGGGIQNLLFTMSQREQLFKIPYEAEGQQIQKLWVDPDYEIFRSLYEEETPFAMSKILVDNEVVTVSVPDSEKESYGPWVESLQKLYSKPLRVISDTDVPPEVGPLWIIGNANSHAQLLESSLKKRQVNHTNKQIHYNSHQWNLDQSAVFIGEKLQSRPVVWVWADSKQPASVLSQKISHYTSYSIIGFTNQKNDFKQTWPVLNSPLIRTF